MAPEDFAIVYQDTDAGPYDNGSSGSQTTFNAGRAVVEASREVRTKLIAAASEMLEAAPADLELQNGAISVVGSPDRRVTIGAVATQVQDDGGLLLGTGSGTAPAKPEHDASACVGRLGFEAFASPTFFCQAARVKVDRATGVVRVLEIAAVNDVGRVLNPRGATGQITGGVVQAIGTALTEGTVYGTDGRQRNAGLLDYKLPTAADAPTIDVGFIEAPAANGGPYGAKGVGEPPIVPTAGAIGNAIAAATGARVRRLPMTPERVWRAMREGSDGAADPGGPLAPAIASAGEPGSGGPVAVGTATGDRR
jgi:CO/xanthine dehydrogenase Mo-binding subunit